MNWLIQNSQQERHPFDQLFEDMLDGFGLATPQHEDGTALHRRFSPHMDVVETDNAYTFTAELAGMSEKDIDITLDKNVLTIRGEKQKENKEEKGKYYRLERSYGQFERRFTLPTDVETDKVEAAFKNGVLTVSVPKPAPEKRQMKKIAVKAGH